MPEQLYCIRCGTRLAPAVIEQRQRLMCANCAYVHYENPLPVVVAVATPPGERLVGLIRRGIAPGRGEWALPGGFMELAETPEEAVLRELREETGLAGTVQGLIGVYSSKSTTYKGLVVIAFHVELEAQEAKPGDEVLEFAFFPQSQHPDLVFPSHTQALLDYEKTYHNPIPTVDAIIPRAGGIVLIQRHNPPHGWALPGGFVDYGESLEAAIRREVKEETGLDVQDAKQLKTYSKANRDPRFHTISTAFIVEATGTICAGDDAQRAAVFTWNQLPEDIAFDHATMIRDYRRRKECSHA